MTDAITSTQATRGADATDLVPLTPPAVQRARKEPPGRSGMPGPRSRLATIWSYRWFVLVALALAGLAGWQAMRSLAGPSVAVDVVKRGDLVQTLVASGHVETPFRVEIGSQITATVEDVLVEEGQSVVQGQPLVRLESRELAAALSQAESAVEQAQARLRQIEELALPAARETLSQARAVLLNAERSHERLDALQRSGAATQAALDEAVKALDVARTLARHAELQVRASSPSGVDHVVAQTQLAQAVAARQSAQSRLGYAVIAAPRSGVLISRKVERGTVAQPGRTLLVLAPQGETQLVIQLDERNLGLVSIGQPALASADAYPNERMQAVVSYINPGIDIARAAVEMKLVVPDPPAYLRQDMTVSVDIEVARRDDTLILPVRAVHDAASRPWVMLVRDDRAHRQPVRIGLRGVTQFEILEGLREGDRVVPVNAGLVTGQKLRPVPP